MFEVEVADIEPLRNLVKAIAAVVEEGCFNVDEARISLLAMDSSRVALVDFELPREFFDEYRCDGEQTISIRIGEFLKFLDRVERDERVKIRLDEERARLVIQCIRPGHTRRFEMTILEPLDEEVPQPKILFKSSARILTQSLREAIRDADLVGEHVKIEVTREALKMSAVGDMGSAFSEWERGADELLELKAEEDSGATFTLSYLKDIVDAAIVSSEVATLEITTDMPIRMDFELSLGRLVYYLAPCIGT
ncbi:MAG: proliferating cell nuclear antigen (pcna) [Candidatus Bathyarchaeota archaeon]|nr:proliferating cell nuclear antigen (pcna) [Candidatus Bathyarchaeota archaeon]